jgi:hypothetical protein
MTSSLIQNLMSHTKQHLHSLKKLNRENDFITVIIPSSIDNKKQKAVFYKTKASVRKPLVVSLHTWNGDFLEYDYLAMTCKEKDLNYIHPNFRGPNNSKDACCSDLAINDIDNAITFAINNSYVDSQKIFIIGVSGGGYAALCSFMKSKHFISKFSIWAPISDLVSWYYESKIRGSKFSKDILDCTCSTDSLNILIAMNRSPIRWPAPVREIKNTQLFIYTGIYDGIKGSVPITHSINFYNKIITDMGNSDTSLFVTDIEKLRLLEFREPLGVFGKISDRSIFLKKNFENVTLTIFEGGHEILPEYALNELLEQ